MPPGQVGHHGYVRNHVFIKSTQLLSKLPQTFDLEKSGQVNGFPALIIILSEPNQLPSNYYGRIGIQISKSSEQVGHHGYVWHHVFIKSGQPFSKLPRSLIAGTGIQFQRIWTSKWVSGHIQI